MLTSHCDGAQRTGGRPIQCGVLVLIICALGAFICTATDRKPLPLQSNPVGLRAGVAMGVIGVVLSASGAIFAPQAWDVVAVAALLIACGVWIWRRRRFAWLAGAAALLPFTGPISLIAAVSAVASAEVVRVFGRRQWSIAILVIIAIGDVCAFQLGLLERYAVAGVGADIQMHPLAAISAGEWQMGVGDVFCAALAGALARSWRGGIAFACGFCACVMWAATAGVTVPASTPALLAVIAVRWTRLPARALTPR